MGDDGLGSGMPSLLMKAAQSAAQADGLPPPMPTNQMQMGGGGGMQPPQPQQPQQQAAKGGGGGGGGGGKKKGPPLRRGKWTPEEEAYAGRLIQEFKAGLLPLTDGTTLRTFLSKLLNCDPMRISKKFVGSNCIGKQVFRRRTAELNRLTPEQIQKSRAELSELERRFLERVAQTNRVKHSSVPSGAAGGGLANSTVPNKPPLGDASQQQHQPLTNQPPPSGSNNGNHVTHKFMSNNPNLGNNNSNHNNNANGILIKQENKAVEAPANPPWLQPPLGYKHGTGQAFAQAHLATTNSRAAAAGRALLGDIGGGLNNNNNNRQQQQQQQQQQQEDSLSQSQQQQQHESQSQQIASNASLMAMAELQRRASQQSLLQSALKNMTNNSSNHQQQQQQSASNLLAAAVRSGEQNGLSGSAMAQISSAARMAEQLGQSNDSSMNDLMLKTGLSRDQLSQLAREQGLSSNSLSNMIQRKNSFDALMSLDFQSLQSIDNLANLIQTGGAGGANVPESGLKNADFGAAMANSRNNLASASNLLGVGGTSSGDLSSAARRLANAASQGRMESLLRNLSNANGFQNMGGGGGGDSLSNSNLSNFLQSMQGNLNSFGGGSGNGQSTASRLFDQGGSFNQNGNNGMNNNNNNNGGNNNGNNNNQSSAVSLANLFRHESGTGLSALRMQDGLNQRNNSVDDFLSLVAAGDIPHQDPSLLNVPLMQQQDAAAKFLAQQQMLQGAGGTNTSALANALASHRSFGSMAAAAAAQANGGGSSFQNLQMTNSAGAAALAMAQARASGFNVGGDNNKRKLEDLRGEYQLQGSAKR